MSAKVIEPVHLDAILEELHGLEHGRQVMDVLGVSLAGRERKHSSGPWRHVNLHCNTPRDLLKMDNVCMYIHVYQI